MSTRNQWRAAAAGVVCCGLVLGTLFLITPRALPPLGFRIVGRTNDLAGLKKVQVRVINYSRRIHNYAYWAQVQTTNGWANASNWEAQHPGQLHWIRSHDTNQIDLPPPEGASVWRLKFMRELQPNALEWKWYALVRRTGLRRMGLREQPRRSYFFTEEITE
jgi:hypothetical protein